MDKITAQTSVEDVLKKYPTLVHVFIEHRLPCLVCGEPFWGTIEELSRQHHIDVKGLINKLNQKKREIDEKI